MITRIYLAKENKKKKFLQGNLDFFRNLIFRNSDLHELKLSFNIFINY